MNTNLELLKLIIREAWRTLSMLPDPDARFRRMLGGGWVIPIQRSVRDGDYPSEIYTKMIPSPAEITIMDEVFVWLVWLRGVEGEYAVKRISWWAMQQPIWKIAQREGCSERTVTRKIDRSVQKIGVNFKGEIEKIIPMFEAGPESPAINEPEIKPERIRGFRDFGEKVPFEAPDTVEPGRVYVGGEGMRFKGKKYQSALDYAERGVENRGSRK